MLILAHSSDGVQFLAREHGLLDVPVVQVLTLARRGDETCAVIMLHVLLSCPSHTPHTHNFEQNTEHCLRRLDNVSGGAPQMNV